jgi:hypothetical protein
MIIKVFMRFDLESSLYEAKQRCFWFIDKYETHGLLPDTFSMISTEMLCDLYNIDINYFKLKK